MFKNILFFVLFAFSFNASAGGVNIDKAFLYKIEYWSGGRLVDQYSAYAFQEELAFLTAMQEIPYYEKCVLINRKGKNLYKRTTSSVDNGVDVMIKNNNLVDGRMELSVVINQNYLYNLEEVAVDGCYFQKPVVLKNVLTQDITVEVGKEVIIPLQIGKKMGLIKLKVM